MQRIFIIILVCGLILTADSLLPFTIESTLGQAEPYSVQDLGANNPIDCDFARFNYCQSEAPLGDFTSFAPLSSPVPNSIVHFAYRGTGWASYLQWPTNFKASSAGSISNQPTLVQYGQFFALGPWDQDFFFDGTNYIAETPGFIEAAAGTYGWLFTNYLAVDAIAYGQVQGPIIVGDTYFPLQEAYLWMPLIKASATITLYTSSMFSGVVDLIEDSVGGHAVTFVPSSGYTLSWATTLGTAPSLNTGPNAHNVFFFFAAGAHSIVGFPVGAPQALAGSVMLGGSQLAGGQCTTGGAIIHGAVPGDVVEVTPFPDPDPDPSLESFSWKGIVTKRDNVVVKVCAAKSATPAIATYNIRVSH
jgi:hypothetical protein